MKFFNFKIFEIAVFFAMLFYVCGQNLVFVSCKSTALQRFTRNNFFYKNGRTWPQLELYNFWPWVTSGKIFFQRMRRIDARRGIENFKALFPTEFELLTKNHQGGGPLAPPPSGRGLKGLSHRGRVVIFAVNAFRWINLTPLITNLHFVFLKTA